MKNKIKILIILFLFNSINIYCANPGDLDTTYNSGGSLPGTNAVVVNGGFAASIFDNAIQADQKCVMVGNVSDNINLFILLSRFNNDGTLDTATFNSSDPTNPGMVITSLIDSSANSVAIQTDQKIVIAGFSVQQPTVPTANGQNLIVARYDTSGNLDATFGSDPFGAGFAGVVYADFGMDSAASSVVIQTDGKIIAAGYDSAQNNILMTRFNTDGSLDTTFGNSGLVITTGADVGIAGISRVNALDVKLTSEQKIVICGFTGNGINAAFVARYNNDGTLDTTFNAGGAAPGFSIIDATGAADSGVSLAIQDDQKIVLGIAGGVPNSIILARLNSDGTLDTDYGTNGLTAQVQANGENTQLSQIAIQADQKIVAIGSTAASTQIALARFDVNGTLDSTFINSNSSTPAGTVVTSIVPSNFGTAVSIQDDQKIVAGGFNNGEILIARYLSGPFVTITSPTINQVLNNAQPTISGNMQIGDTIVQVSIDGGAFVSATTINSGAGTWSFVPASPLSEGSHTVQASTTDSNNVTSFSSIIPFSIDTQTFVTITSPISNQVINNAQPTITGTMEVGNLIVQVSIDSGAFVNATTINSSAGTWSFTPGSPLSEGGHSVQAQTQDPLGNTAQTFITFFSIDTTTFVTITSPTINEIINNAQPTITGTMETTNTIVQVSLDGGSLQSAIVDNFTGTWTFTPVASLADGSHTVQAFTQDSVGNTAQTGVIPFIINTITSVTITFPTSNEVVNNAQPTITGTMEVGNTIVQVSIDGGSLQNATVNSGAGTWSFTPGVSLAEGSHTVQAFTTDPQGATAQTSVIPFTVDTITFVTITSPTPNEVVNNQRPLITGTMEVGNTIVQVSIDGGALQNAIVISGSGTWSFTPSSILTNGSHTVQAFTTDQVGNTAQTSVIPFTVNAQTFVTITSPKNGETITTSRPLLTGATAPGNTVEIIIDGVSVGFAIVDSSGNWVFQVTSPLTNGVHTIEIIATTPTGDVASVTISVTVAAAVCILPADILTQAIRNKYGQ